MVSRHWGIDIQEVAAGDVVAIAKLINGVHHGQGYRHLIFAGGQLETDTPPPE